MLCVMYVKICDSMIHTHKIFTIIHLYYLSHYVLLIHYVISDASHDPLTVN